MSVWVNNRHSGITLFKAYNLGPIKNEKPNTTLEKPCFDILSIAKTHRAYKLLPATVLLLIFTDM